MKPHNRSAANQITSLQTEAILTEIAQIDSVLASLLAQHDFSEAEQQPPEITSKSLKDARSKLANLSTLVTQGLQAPRTSSSPPLEYANSMAQKEEEKPNAGQFGLVESDICRGASTEEITKEPNKEAFKILDEFGYGDFAWRDPADIFVWICNDSRDLSESLPQAVLAQLSPLETGITYIHKRISADLRQPFETLVARFGALQLAIVRPYYAQAVNRKIGRMKARSLQEQVQEMAARIWATDWKREKRLKDVVKEILPQLQPESGRRLPGLERLKDWIKPVAPLYARKGGAPKKPK